MPAQAQKHVTVNESIRMLDAVIQINILDRDLTSPPVNPADGDRYIVAASPTGSWATKANQIAAYQDCAWMFYAPREGFTVWVADEDGLVTFNGTAWVVAGGGSINPTPLVGVNAAADSTNRLSVASAATLLNHEGAGHQAKINKANAADTASLLFQTGFSGRAEIGTTGNDDLQVKVSADGAIWREALIADRLTGAVRLPGGLIDATTLQRPVQLLPTTVRDIWRSDMDAPGTPRTYTISAVSGTTVTIATSEVEHFFNVYMQNVSMVRIWNTSKSPAQAAWVDWNLAANQFRVSHSAHITGWLPGETLRIGDPNPTSNNTLQMVAIDISKHLYNAHGIVFRQRGLKISVSPLGIGGRISMDCSGNGVAGTAFGVSSNSDGSRQSAFIDVFTTDLSPISNSNLLFIHESLAGGTAMAATRLLRLVGVWV